MTQLVASDLVLATHPVITAVPFFVPTFIVVAVVGILGVCAGAVYWFTTSQKSGITADLHVYAPEHLSALPPVSPESANTVPLGAPPAVVTGTTGFEVIDRQADGTPVAWDPCQPIYYVVNNAQAPEGGPELLRGAIDKVAFVEIGHPTALLERWRRAIVSAAARERAGTNFGAA